MLIQVLLLVYRCFRNFIQRNTRCSYRLVGCKLYFIFSITSGNYLFEYKGKDQIKHTSDKLLEIYNGKNAALNEMEPRCKCILTIIIYIIYIIYNLIFGFK